MPRIDARTPIAIFAVSERPLALSGELVGDTGEDDSGVVTPEVEMLLEAELTEEELREL